MSTVKRVAPDAAVPREDRGLHMFWVQQCLQDLAAGRHAVGCECSWRIDHIPTCTPEMADEPDYECRCAVKFYGACSEIVRCALEMRDYECEVGDAEA